eukprot:89840_1
MAEQQALKQDDVSIDITEDTQILTEQDKVCCGCCSLAGAFYAFSVEYILVSILLFVLFLSTAGDLPNESWWMTAIIVIASLSRFFVGVLGIYMTSKLFDKDPNNTPKEGLINLWTFLMLWVPIIFNTLWIFFTTMLVFALTVAFGGGEIGSQSLLLIIAFQTPPIIDIIIAVMFYSMVNRFIEKTTNRTVYACPCCNCC